MQVVDVLECAAVEAARDDDVIEQRDVLDVFTKADPTRMTALSPLGRAASIWQ